MTAPDGTFDRVTVERVAQEYRDKGYQVVVQPDVTQRPDFVREYQPDISDVLRVRSAIAHGFAPPETVDLAPVLDLIETSARELLADAGQHVELVRPGT